MMSVSPEIGIAATPYDKRDGTIIRQDAGGNDVQRFPFTGGWVKKKPGYKFDKAKSEVLVHEVVLSVDSCVPEF